MLLFIGIGLLIVSVGLAYYSGMFTSKDDLYTDDCFIDNHNDKDEVRVQHMTFTHLINFDVHMRCVHFVCEMVCSNPQMIDDASKTERIHSFHSYMYIYVGRSLTTHTHDSHRKKRRKMRTIRRRR